MTYIVNANRDAVMNRSHPVGEIVEFVKVCKSGLILVKDNDGKEYTLAKFNLDEYPRGNNND